MPPTKWDRHAILAEIKRRYGTLRAFAATTPLTETHFSVALAEPRPQADRLIAKALGVPLNQLWPDRYDARGRRITNRSSGQDGKASPIRSVNADTGGAA